jgi:RNA polymerase sigma factor (sigma-70 family)
METALVVQAYDAYHDQLHRYLAAMTRDGEQAQDLVHESFMRLTREVRAGRAPDNPRAWLYRVGRNLVISGARRQQVAERNRDRLVQRDYTASAEDQYVWRESGSELRALLGQLDWIDRTSLLMAAEGYSGAEIARIVGRSENAVRTRMCRARTRLRHGLEASEGVAQVA